MNPDVTQILNQLGEGDRASEEMVSAIYDELRQMAAGKMANERAGHTLQATALVNEACILLLGNDRPWSSRRHFYGAASEAMRRILIDSARRKQAEKRGAGVADTEFRDSFHGLPETDDRLVQIHEVLDELEEEDPLKAQIVKLRCFVGLTIPETAKLLEIGERTVGRHWELARIWLYEAITEEN